MDKSTDQILTEICDNSKILLGELLPDDANKPKKRKSNSKNGKPKSVWDVRKISSLNVAGSFSISHSYRQQRQAARIKDCANVLRFVLVEQDGKNVFRFENAQFCGSPACANCAALRAKKMLARFLKAFPSIHQDYPTMRYVLLTLTVKNCHVSELNDTIKLMNAAWQRLSQRKAFPALGFIRSLEVTKEEDKFDKKGNLIQKANADYVHPHFHILLGLPSSYFGGYSYLSTEKWVALWRNALRADYDPICDVRIVKPRKKDRDGKEYDTTKIIDGVSTEWTLDALMASVSEVVKYAVKPSDTKADDDKSKRFVCDLFAQLQSVRCVALGGIFKEYIKKSDKAHKEKSDDLDVEPEILANFFFGWRDSIKRYQHQSRNND